MTQNIVLSAVLRLAISTIVLEGLAENALNVTDYMSVYASHATRASMIIMSRSSGLRKWLKRYGCSIMAKLRMSGESDTSAAIYR